MATQQKFVDFIIEQINIPEQINYKKMFGEYGLYFGNKMFALVCDNKLFIKPTSSGREYINDVVEEAPYLGAKPCFLMPLFVFQARTPLLRVFHQQHLRQHLRKQSVNIK